MVAETWQQRAAPVVAEVLRAHEVPGMTIAVARGGGPAEHLVAGTDGAGTPLAADTLFPVASITKLAMCYSNVGDAGAQALAASSSITRLALVGNCIGEEGALALLANPAIIALDLRRNDIGPRARIALLKVKARFELLLL